MIWLVLTGVLYGLFFSAILDPKNIDGLTQGLIVGGLRGFIWVGMMISLFRGLVQIGVL